MPTAQQLSRTRRGNRRPKRTASKPDAASDKVNDEPAASSPAATPGDPDSDKAQVIKFKAADFKPTPPRTPSIPTAKQARQAKQVKQAKPTALPLVDSDSEEEDEATTFFHQHHAAVTRTIHYLTHVYTMDHAADPALLWPPASIRDMHAKDQVAMSLTFQDIAVLEAFVQAKEAEADFFQDHLQYFDAIDVLREMTAEDQKINLSRRVLDIKLWESVAHGQEVLREVAAMVETQRVYFGVQLEIVKRLDKEIKELEEEQRKYDWKLGLLNAAHCASDLYPIRGEGFDQATLDRESEAYREARGRILPLKWKLEASLGNCEIPVEGEEELQVDMVGMDVSDLMAMFADADAYA